jgi:LysR family transcriptional activator of nhaA
MAERYLEWGLKRIPSKVLNYNHLHYFHVAAVAGSVKAAAEKLGVTQPTVSEQIRALERTLTVSLFERLPSGLKLTEAGRLAFEHTSVMFRASERLLESLGNERPDLPRTLRVGISGAVARSTTTDFLMPLLAIEGCVPTIRTGDGVELVRDLRSNELDLVLCESEPPEAARRGLEIAQLDSIALVVVAPPSLELGAHWQEVGLVQYRESSSYRWDVESFLTANDLVPRIAAESDDALFLLEAAARGGYVAIVPRSLARDAVASGRLAIVQQVDPARTTGGVYAVFHDGDSAELARHAVELLVERVRAHNGH